MKLDLIESLGSNQYQFETKWYKLQDFVAQHGELDVLILGSSIVNTGVSPDDVNEVFQENAGTKLKIFNFGVEGFPINLTELIAEKLLITYQPKILIIGSEIRDLSAETALRRPSFILVL